MPFTLTSFFLGNHCSTNRISISDCATFKNITSKGRSCQFLLFIGLATLGLLV